MFLLKNKLPFLLSMLLLVSCAKKDSILSTNFEKNQAIEEKQSNNVIKGKAEFQSFKIKADNSIQFASRATVSLIYPYNYSNASLQNATIATGLSDINGNFSINLDSNFVPELNQLYVVEASKRLYGFESPLISLRTYIMWNGSTWKSITKPNITINKKTTVLSLYPQMKEGLIEPIELIDRIDENPDNPSIKFDIKLSSKIYNFLLEHIEIDILRGIDPVDSIFNIFKTEELRPIFAVKTNTFVLRTYLETYAVDWGGIYPNTFEQLRLEASSKGYYKSFQNPFGNLFSGEKVIDYSEYEQAKNTLVFKGNPIISKEDLRGYVIYEPILNTPVIKYYLYGVDAKGDFIKDVNDTFYLSNN